MKTAEQTLHDFKKNSSQDGVLFTMTDDDITGLMKSYSEQSKYDLSKLPTVQELRVIRKNYPDTFLIGALYIIELLENKTE